MPDRVIQFLPECHADTTLLRHFIPDHRHSIHTLGCPEVARTMQSIKTNDYKLIGVVDNDKDLETRCQGFFKSFAITAAENKIILRANPDRQQYLIVIDKAIESFLIWNAEQVAIDLTTYGFSHNVKQFKTSTKSPTIETDENYRQLLADLYVRRAPGFLTLEQMLNDLIITR